jgi:hypothetical protein
MNIYKIRKVQYPIFWISDLERGLMMVVYTMTLDLGIRDLSKKQNNVIHPTTNAYVIYFTLHTTKLTNEIISSAASMKTSSLSFPTDNNRQKLTHENMHIK